MALHTFPSQLAVDKATGRGVAGAVGAVTDRFTGAPVDVLDSQGNPKRLLTNHYGYFEEFRTSDQHDVIVMTFGRVSLTGVALEIMQKASEAPAQISALTAQYLQDVANQNTKITNLDARVEGVEALAGLSPATPVDGQTANLIEQPGTLTNAALSAAIGDYIADLPPSGGVDMLGALGILRARMLAKDTAPVLLVFAGSSTTEGSNVGAGDRWINRIAAKASGNPVPYGLAAATAAAPYGPGVTLANIGRSGMHSGSYISVAEATTIGGWNPTIVMHAVGANDAVSTWGTPTFVSNNIRARIDAIDAAASKPVGHVLMHQHERYDQVLKFPWPDYLAKLRQLASEYRNVTVFDAAQMFYAISVPSTDPLGFMETDKMHANESGHAYYAEIIGDFLKLPAYVPPKPPVPVLSDNFNRADGTLHGSAPTVGTATWQVLSGTVTVTGNKAVASGTGATAVIETGKTDLDLYTTIDYAGPGNVAAVFKTLDIDNRYGIFLESATTSLKLYRTVGGTSTVVASSAALGASPLGTHQVHVKIRGAQIEATVSGVTLTYTSPNPTGEAAWTKVGIRGSAGSPATFDDFSATTPAS